MARGSSFAMRRRYPHARTGRSSRRLSRNVRRRSYGMGVPEMTSLRRRASVLAAVVLACTCLVVAHDAAANWDSNPITGVDTAQDYACGTHDHPEGAIQGHIPTTDTAETARDANTHLTPAETGYNCGLALVGHTTLDGVDPDTGKKRPATGNANMAWAGNCAYVSGPSGAVAPESKPSPADGAGVAVVDVSDPENPVHVRTLSTTGSLSTRETIGAVTTRAGRSILVGGQYGNDQVSDPKPMDIYDVTDCANPVFKETFMWPDNIHNLTISPDGRYVFATQPLQVLDISPLWDNDPATDAIYLGNIDDHMEGPMFSVGPSADVDDALPQAVREAQPPSYTSHEAWPQQRVDPKDGTVH